MAVSRITDVKVIRGSGHLIFTSTIWHSPAARNRSDTPHRCSHIMVENWDDTFARQRNGGQEIQLADGSWVALNALDDELDDATNFTMTTARAEIRVKMRAILRTYMMGLEESDMGEDKRELQIIQSDDAADDIYNLLGARDIIGEDA